MTYGQEYPQTAASEATSVYRYYDASDLLLYVGITSRGIRRNIEHNDSKEWWPFVVRQEVDHHPTRRAALTAERELIRRFRPPFNRQHNIDSAELRAAYFKYATAQPSTPTEESVLMRALPLAPLERDGANLTLATLPEHSHLTKRIKPVIFNQVPCRDSVGRQIGHVIQVDHYGLRATVTVRLKVDVGAAISHGSAALKQMHNAAQGVLRLSRVDLNGSELPALVYAMTKGLI